MPVPAAAVQPKAAQFAVWVVSRTPIQAACFAEVARNVIESLRALGHSVVRVVGITTPRSAYDHIIVIGANILDDAARRLLPRNVIIYQLEQPGSRWMTESYVRMLRAHRVWDFSPHGVDELRKAGCSRVQLCRIGAAEPETQSRPAPHCHKDIDVLFYGSHNPRRLAILNELRARRLSVHDKMIWGEERSALVARAKVVLNIHYYETAVLEVVRLVPLFEQGAFVVSETGVDPELEQLFAHGAVFASYAALVDTVAAQLARPPEARAAIAQRGREALSGLSQTEEIRRCLAEVAT